MKLMRYILVITVLLSVMSCNKILDTKPTDFVDPASSYKTAEQLQSALNGVYNSFGTILVFGNNYLYMFNSNTDESYTRLIELAPTYQYDAADPKVEDLWEGLYQGIQRSNLLLASVDSVEMDTVKRNIIKGETLFLRGYSYFMLASNFGDVPLITKPTPSVLNVNIARSPLKEVYNQILDDMIKAEKLLETQTATSLGFGGKVSKTAVQGMLARVCLYMAGFPLNDKTKYEDAKSWALKVVDSREHALNADYKQVFINYAKDEYDIKESMWELEFWGNNRGGINLGNTYAGRFCGILCQDDAVGFSSGSINATRKLFNLYELNAASTATPNKASFDMRRDWNCANYTWGSGVTARYTRVTNTWLMNAGKWRREYEVVNPKDKNYTSQNYAVLRYSDVLLMLAEAENEIHGPENAYQYVNEVRKRGYGILYGNVIKHIAVTSGGSGYTTAPTVNIVGGGGMGATAEAVVTNGQVTGVNIITSGTLTPTGPYYSSVPTITFTGGGGSGATATATITQATDANLLPAQINNKENLKLAIKDERARELCFEAFRRNDLIRWGDFVGDMKRFLTYANSNAGTAANITTAATQVSSRNIFLPIPIRDLSLNKLLVQNPGY